MKNRYLYILFLLLMVFISKVSAQTFYEVTTLSGSQSVGGNNVTVSTVNGPGMYVGFCVSDMAYHMSFTTTSAVGYNFNIANPVTRLRLQFLGIENNGSTQDTISFRINGTDYAINTAQLSNPFAGICIIGSGSFSNAVANIKLYSTPFIGGSGAQLDIVPGYLINSAEIISNPRPVANGTAMRFFFAQELDTIAYPVPPLAAGYCLNDTFRLYYNVTHAFKAGNSFSAQLSDASGSFAVPVTIGSSSAAGAGNIFCTIPAGMAAGTGYRIRIVSTLPAMVSGDNGSNIAIRHYPGNPTATATGPACTNRSITLGVTNPAPGNSFSWTGPLSFTSGTQNPTISNLTSTHSGDYIVTITDPGTGCKFKDTVLVSVSTRPTMPTLLSNTPVCQGQVLTLSVTNQGGGVITYWNGPLSFTATGNTVQIPNANIAQGGLYRVSVKSTAGCSSDTLDIIATVKPLPLNPMAGSNSPVCEGGQLLLNSSSPTLGATYSWAGPNGYSSNTQNPIIDPVAANGAGNYEVTAVLNGCNSAGKGIATVVVNTVTYLGAYASPNDTVCAGTLVALVVVPVNGGATAQYQWFRNGVEIQGATNLTYNTSNYVTGDTFYCRLRSTDVCATPITIYSNKVGMMVLPTPGVPKASVLSNPQKPLPGAPVAFSVTVVNGGGQNPTYQWQRNGQNIGGAIYNNWSTNNLAPYDKINCLVSSSDPCISPATFSSDTVGINFPSGINDISYQDDMVIYPNPNTGSCTVQLNSKASGKAGISIRNNMGQLVYKNEYELKEGANQLGISHQLAAGMYYLQLQTPAGISYSKMTVE